MSLICLDAEFANGNRMLELAIHDADGTQLFHEYFKPEGLRWWRSDIHHITPDMVRGKRPFKAHIHSIQNIIDSADRVIGFALNNDFEKMSNEGIEGLADKPVVELRNWYWMCIGQYEGVAYGNGPGLGAVAERFGITFEDGAEHTASGDTLMTLRCYGRLLEIFSEKFLTPEQAALPVGRRLDLFDQIYEQQREPHVRELAHGYCTLLKTPLGYKLKCGHLKPQARQADDDDTRPVPVATIEVNCRHTAELELRNLLQRRAVRKLVGVYDLRPVDIDRFKAYTNTFDMTRSEYNHKLLKMRTSVRLL